MNKNMFWGGMILQAIHLFGLFMFFGINLLPSVDLSFINKTFMLGLGYILFNILTLIMILAGCFARD